jgi:hypothetical protein
VFRPETADIPLSRRPRERVEFRSGGAATIWKGGPDDRPAPIAARWIQESDDLVVRDSGGGVRLRVIEQSPDRLLVKLSL